MLCIIPLKISEPKSKIVTTAKKGFTAIKVLIIPLAPIATGMVTSEILKNGVRIVPRGVVPIMMVMARSSANSP